jgi:hypothetical protein
VVVFKNSGMKFILLIAAVCLMGCSQKAKDSDKQGRDSSIVTFRQAEDVTGVVRALFPAPNSFNIREAKKWMDATGENWLVLYETGSFIPKGSTGATAKLSSVLFLKADSGFLPVWKVNDFITDCELDVTTSFYENHLSVSDLDQNGIAEIMMVYALSCKGDVSPHQKKLILYEGKKKFAIRGEELMIMAKDTIGGNYQIDSGFNQLPSAIKDSALSHWQKFGITKYQ